MGFKSLVFWLLLMVTVGSVGWRAMLAPSGPAGVAVVVPDGEPISSVPPPADVGSPPAVADPPPAAADQEQQSRLAAILPSVSEAASFGLGAFCLAYGSRRSLKHALLLLLLAVVGVWGLGRLDVMFIDWPRAGELIRAYVLNTNSDGSVWQILLDRVPTVVTVAVAYACGYRKR